MNNKKVNFHENDFNYDEYAEEIRNKKEVLGTIMNKQEASKVLENATKDGIAWDKFYKRETNPYKPRRYLTTEFPCLLIGQSVLFKLLPDWLRKFSLIQSLTFCKRKFLFDIGSGYGSALFPLMLSNPCLHVLACDLSETAINELNANPNFDPNRMYAHPWDITTGMPPSLSTTSSMHGNVDLVLLVFTLSAIDPNLHVEVLRNIGDSLSSGGVICFRDRALYDLTMMRSKQRLGQATFAREDGTLAHYFTVEELERIVPLAGLEFVDGPKYCTVSMKNRQKGTSMKRCFIHTTLRRRQISTSHELISSRSLTSMGFLSLTTGLLLSLALLRKGLLNRIQ